MPSSLLLIVRDDGWKEYLMKKVAIIQTRMTSTRLPGKVLMEVVGRPLLAHQIDRVRRCSAIDEIVIATTMNATDDPVVALCEREGVRWFRGSENDVLARYLGAARESRAEMVVRITSDCPLIDPTEIGRVVSALEVHAGNYDYASNIIRRTFPRGLDTEALFIDVLERANRMGTSAASREHVTYFVHGERPELFLLLSVYDGEDNSDLRWTVDTPEDFQMVKAIYEGMELGARFADYREIVAFVRRQPAISAINHFIEQKKA